jgi:hypothetical protein
MKERKMQRIPDFCQSVNIDLMFDGKLARAEGRMINRVMGVVQSYHVGLVRAGVRIKIMERTDLRVKWPIENEQIFLVGQRVVVTIPAEAVQLEAGIFRRSKQRWNRWIGRIVLVKSGDTGTVYTVKIHGESWTLKAYGPVIGARQPSKAWDAVNVVVDPQRVDLTSLDMRSWHQEADLILSRKNIK